ncbi:hypothetical protein OIU84_002207 [Salix udensis]|uniref:Protein kinase domain-containing protein n=1 Tax=Salix udensis TaxID=889485 RepID=A0AAD6K564_9ROSI|nr:hypothetical protein OIU84_002207 [Salix udensis]
MSPEVARGEHQGFPADIWAFGCTFLEMATGQAPWVNVSDPVSALYQIGFSGNVPEIPSFMSQQAKDFLSKCLKRDPQERWSASELLTHDFITDQEPDFALKKVMSRSNVNTPTCVLDQVLWDSIEEVETTWDSTHKSSSLVSPIIERIKQLTEANGEVPIWSWDDTWVTVRSNDQEMVPCCEDYNLAYANVRIGDSGAEIAWVSIEYDFVFLNHEPTNVCANSTCKASSSGSCGDGRRHKTLSMPFERRKDAFCSTSFFFEGNKLRFSTWQFLHII